jgi:hypothetical protein
MGNQGAHDRPDVLHQGVGATGPAHRGDHRRRVGRGPSRDGAGADAGQHPAAQQVGLLLPGPHRQTRQVVLDVAGGQTLHRPRPRILRVADGRSLGNELFKLTGLGPRQLFGAALDEDPLPRHGVGGAGAGDSDLWQRRCTCASGQGSATVSMLPSLESSSTTTISAPAGTVAATAPTVVESMSPSSRETITTLTGGVLGGIRARTPSNRVGRGPG